MEIITAKCINPIGQMELYGQRNEKLCHITWGIYDKEINFETDNGTFQGECPNDEMDSFKMLGGTQGTKIYFFGDSTAGIKI